MPYADNQGLRVHYLIEGEGPPLVLQHGFTGSLKDWYECGYVEALKSDYQLILIDARGHGGSDKPHDPADYTLDRRVSDVVAVLDELNLSKVLFWGYSMGARFGYGMAKYAPERLEALVIGGAHPYERIIPESARLDGTDPHAFVAALEARLKVTMSPEERDEILANDFEALAAAQQDWPSLGDILPTITMPCLLYVSDADPYYARTYEGSQHIPNAQFFALHGLDHAAGFRESSLVLPRVIEFLQTVSKAGQIAN